MSRNRSGHKGVEAIFSPLPRKRRNLRLVGVVGVLAGLAEISITIIATEYPRAQVSQITDSYMRLALASLGLLLVSCGLGLLGLDWNAANQRLKSRATMESRNAKQYLIGEGDEETLTGSNYNSRIGLTVFILDCVLVTLYASLVEEYQSNSSMRNWVASYFNSGSYLFDWPTLIASSGLLGLLAIWSFAGETFKE